MTISSDYYPTYAPLHFLLSHVKKAWLKSMWLLLKQHTHNLLKSPLYAWEWHEQLWNSIHFPFWATYEIKDVPCYNSCTTLVNNSNICQNAEVFTSAELLWRIEFILIPQLSCFSWYLTLYTIHTAVVEILGSALKKWYNLSVTITLDQ